MFSLTVGARRRGIQKHGCVINAKSQHTSPSTLHLRLLYERSWHLSSLDACHLPCPVKIHNDLRPLTLQTVIIGEYYWQEIVAPRSVTTRGFVFLSLLHSEPVSDFLLLSSGWNSQMYPQARFLISNNLSTDALPGKRLKFIDTGVKIVWILRNEYTANYNHDEWKVSSPDCWLAGERCFFNIFTVFMIYLFS